MTKLVKDGLLPPTPHRKLQVGDVFSWGTQDAWYLKTRKGARAIGRTYGGSKRNEAACEEISKLASFCIAPQVQVKQ